MAMLRRLWLRLVAAWQAFDAQGADETDVEDITPPDAW